LNQVSSVPFGVDATQFQGYAESANDRLGALDFVFENTGPNYAYIRLAQHDGTTSPSGYATIDTTYTTTAASTSSSLPGAYAPTAGFQGFAVAPGGTVTRHYVLLSKRVCFFGSGNTIVNISAVLRNKADLRGAQIDIVAVGRRGWGLDEGWNANELVKKWGTVTGPATTYTAAGASPNISAGPGLVSITSGTNSDNYQPYSG
jgi:hypothetical protein